MSEFIPEPIRTWAGYIALLYLFCAVAYWIYLRIKERSYFTEAIRFYTLGKHDEALKQLCCADRSWKFNFAHDKPGSYIKDLSRLEKIFRQVELNVEREGEVLILRNFQDVYGQLKDNIAALKNIYSDRSNFILKSDVLDLQSRTKAEEIGVRIADLRKEIWVILNCRTK